MLDERQPGDFVDQLEMFAWVLGECFALPQGDIQAAVFQALAQLRLAGRVAHDAQLFGRVRAHQQILGGFAVGQMALVVERQRGAVLGLFVHAPLACVEVHAHMAAEGQHGLRLHALDAPFGDIRARHDQRAQIDAGLLLGFQGQQGGGHMLAIEPHWAAATTADVPLATRGVQGDALLIGLRARAATAGQQRMVLEAEQRAAPLLGIADAALEIPGTEIRAPVFLAQAQNIQGHRASPAGERSSLGMALPNG